MILPKGGVTWKSARARLPPSRAVLYLLTRTRFLLALALTGLMVLVWRGISSSGFVCWGPSKSPREMTINEMADWQSRAQTPVVFNHHVPLAVNASTIQRIDLNPIRSTAKAAVREERVLILTPLRDAALHLNKHFDLLSALTYPHHLIDLAFLVGDSTDDTLATLAAELDRIQQRPDHVAFHNALIVEKNFGLTVGQADVKQRHSFAAQGPRRKAMGRARNYLLSAALKPHHSWVYWRDVDVVDSPERIIEDFVAHDKDILVPSYKEYVTGRDYLALKGDWRHNPDVEIELDGIGGVNILVKADVHRSGINFPCYPFENQAETEGFAKMAKRAGYQVVGLPNYVVWHVDTKEEPGNA
ncbi:MAG: hypothetical protein M1826_005789 [Phylliscum demangeonii]|nr:MAG: hypothetical protein M1826_005789 [Phylliscum demangeonii]